MLSERVKWFYNNNFKAEVNLIVPTTQRAERVAGAVAHPCAAQRRLTLMDVNRFLYVHTSFPFDPEVRRFEPTVSWNRCGSWLTTPIVFRSESWVTESMPWPSMVPLLLNHLFVLYLYLLITF